MSIKTKFYKYLTNVLTIVIQFTVIFNLINKIHRIMKRLEIIQSLGGTEIYKNENLGSPVIVSES